MRYPVQVIGVVRLLLRDTIYDRGNKQTKADQKGDRRGHGRTRGDCGGAGAASKNEE
jgi:hypothetical protein